MEVIEISSDDSSGETPVVGVDANLSYMGPQGSSSSPLRGLFKSLPEKYEENHINPEKSLDLFVGDDESLSSEEDVFRNKSPVLGAEESQISHKRQSESQQPPEIISLDDTIEELSFSFSSQPIPAAKKRKIDKVKKMSADFESARKSTLSPLRDLSKYSLQQLNELNKKRNREDVMEEMIVYLPEPLFSTVDHKEFEGATVKRSDSDVHWKRLVLSLYDSQRDIFIPADPLIIDEKHEAVYYKAEDFVKDLVDAKISRDSGCIIVVEKYQQYLSKIASMENKVFRNKVLGKETQQVEITVKEVETLVNKLEYQQKITVFPVRSTEEAVSWLCSFTYTIGIGRYDYLNRNAEFSNLIPGKSGTDFKSTFIETMTKFKLMTKMRAERLLLYYNSLYKIYQRFVMHDSLGEGEDLRRLVPDTAEQAMKALFTSDNPNQVIYNH